MGRLNPHHYPAEIRECWAVHQAFRSMGFAPEDIFVALGKDARHPDFEATLFVVLKAQGKEFIVTLAAYDSERQAEAMLDKWTDFVTLWKDEVFDDDVMEGIYQESNVIQNKIEFVVALHNKGIRPTKEWL